MPIPKYNEMYRSFLTALQDGEIHSLKEVKGRVIDQFALSDIDLSERLDSNKQSVFDNRIGWCRTYLKKAGLISSPAKAQFVISETGKELLHSGAEINNVTLHQYPSFVKFVDGSHSKSSQSETVMETETPQETLERMCEEIEQELCDEILAEILKMDPFRFEQLVVDLLIKMGYGKLKYNSKVTKKSGDEGIDGVVTADKLGFDSVYIQAKRFSNGVVGRPDLQKFVGALAGQGAQKGLFITSSKFSREAELFVEKNINFKIALVDGNRLTKLMIEYGLGVTTEATYCVRRLDSDFFAE